jgi:hypothetical protein
MKNLCLICDDEERIGTRSTSESDVRMKEYFAFTTDIRGFGHCIGSKALRPVQAATIMRLRNGKVSATDGPFAETKEQPGGSVSSRPGA